MELRTCILFIVWTLASVPVNGHTICTPVYGSHHDSCSFLPAPPGKTPPCARPGLTYCEYPDRYPGQLIHYLLEKWRYDHSTLLMDETREDFASYVYPPPPPVYGPPNYHNNHHSPHHPFGPSNFLPNDEYYPEPIYIPKPQFPFQDQGGGAYIPPKAGYYNYTNGQDKGGLPVNYKYDGNFPSTTQNSKYYNQQYNPHEQGYFGNPGSLQFAKNIWKRKADGLTRLRRSLRSQLDIPFPSSNVTGPMEAQNRSKRQSPIGGEQLCTSRSNYIMPKAALNNKGNWMYVVNMPEVDSRYSQLVKSETCVSQTCSGICSLPQGYTSRCEQKYVQKRLVALEGAGNNLVTDVFWFPSCCVCTISNT